jgi:cephalosporin-C deacetylase
MIPTPDPAPEDLQKFWQSLTEEAHSQPLDFHLSKTQHPDCPDLVVSRLEFRAMLGRRLSGWLAHPEGARRLPSFLWIPPYGRESVLPNQYGTRPDMASMSLNFHGHDCFHQEAYLPDRGYLAEGSENPSNWILSRMYQDAVIALRVLQAQIEVDEDRLAVAGMSQGAGIGVWMGAFCPLVRTVCADMPFLAAMQTTLEKPVYRYPLKELIDYSETIPAGMERIRHTLSYFDTVNVAAFCKVPTLVSLGLKDPASRPDHVRALYAALPGEKELIEYPGGHDWHEEMVENNRSWMLEHLSS